MEKIVKIIPLSRSCTVDCVEDQLLDKAAIIEI